MPLTLKGKKILHAMMRPTTQGGYGAEKGKRVFYASANSGRITGVERKRSHYPGASMHDSALHAHQARHGIKSEPMPKMRQMMQRMMGH